MSETVRLTKLGRAMQDLSARLIGIRGSQVDIMDGINSVNESKRSFSHSTE